jgi:hypothetical protein
MGALIVTILAGILLVLNVIPVQVFKWVELVSLVWAGLAAVLYFKLGWFKFFYHDFLHWHTPDDSPHSFDGLSEHATCKHCGKDIMQDSQGNWFC